MWKLQELLWNHRGRWESWSLPVIPPWWQGHRWDPSSPSCHWPSAATRRCRYCCLSRVFSQELGSLGELLLMYLSYSVRKSHLFTQQICLECWVHILEAEDTATNKIHRTVHDSHAPIEGAEPPARGCHIKPSTGCHAEGSHKHTHQMNSGGWNNSKVNPARHTSSTLS